MNVQMRDIQILKYVYACRVVTYKQIARRFFAGKHPTLVERCLRRHRNSNYINVHPIRIGNKTQNVVQINPTGFQLIKEQWPFEIDNPLFKSESILHDIQLNEVLLKLEDLRSFKSFFTENLLQSSTLFKTDLPFRDLSKLYADGALFLKGPDGLTYVYGVEFEQSKKAPDRYREKFQAYYRAEGIDGVIYIVSDQTIATSIAKEDAEVCGQGKSLLYFSTLEDVLSSDDKIYFKNNKSQGIELF